MKYLASREEMQSIDSYSIETIGIPGMVLMEKAAISMEEEILRRFPSDTSFLIVVERGNNGGDGLALARLLTEKGYEIYVYEIGSVPKASASYQMQTKILEQLGIKIYKEMPTKEYDVIIDAIFGVGLTREVKGIHKEVMEQLNQKNAYRIAVDVPSGVNASDGKILGIAFQADLTITFGLSKVGLVLYPGASCCGEVCVKDIGFPKKAVEHVHPVCHTFEKEDLLKLPPRKAYSNKGSYGKVLLVAGSCNMAGAAFLCGKAAYRSGSGLVQIFTPEENRIILQAKLPEAILTTYREKEEALSSLEKSLKWATVIGFGPGLGTGETAKMMLKKILSQGKAPLVIDADGINLLAILRKEEPEVLKQVEAYPAGIIFTPHLMEMSRLCGKSVSDIKENLIETAKKEADSSHIFVLKDARTVVSDGGKETYINTSGNHGMSVGGSGDVLTGIICGLLAGGADLFMAARSGVFCHGLAGDEAVKKTGYHGMLATDLIDGLCHVLE